MAQTDRNRYYDIAIQKMVNSSLAAQEERFEELHSGDEDELLLSYLRASALRLHHSPWPKEILGGCYLEKRFGSWEAALTAAKLPPPRTANRPSHFVRVQKETEIQKELYRKKKEAKKVRNKQRMAEQEAKKAQKT